jgi:CDP-paratose 2-epimerase
LKILITGGCGFLGSTLALYLREQEHYVVVMDNLVRRGSESNIERLQVHGVAFVHGDVRCAEDFTGLPAGIELICDASAQPSVVSGYTKPMFDLTNNTLGVIHVLEYAREHRCPLIFCGTNRIYSADRINTKPRRESTTRLESDSAAWRSLSVNIRPPGFDPEHGISEEFSLDGAGRSIYGVSKLMADVVCQEYADAFEIRVIVNRLGVISGAGQFGKIDQGCVVWWAVACWFSLPLKYIGGRKTSAGHIVRGRCMQAGGTEDRPDQNLTERCVQCRRRRGERSFTSRSHAVPREKIGPLDADHSRRESSQGGHCDLYYRQP